ncbi:surface attachment protein Sap1 [Burkholderia anthina]|uniref:surface attachment protein Sap1 n=1 Tax=Burkholderia anthina TaxID=179879 RepID=UPI00158B97A7|nr:hypothetical protein [Burkholderia anthina]
MKRSDILAGIIFSTSIFFVVSNVSAEGERLKPKQEIRLTTNAWGCLSRDYLDSVTKHERHGQRQESQRYFDEYRCLPIPEGRTFRVVAVDRDYVQFASVDNGDVQGLWTDSRFIKR